MSQTPEYLALEQFAELAGISRQAAWKACTRENWRGARLETKECRGRGGRAGLRYEIKISSLPNELQLALKPSASLQMAQPAPRFSPGGLEAGWWQWHLAPLLAIPKGSAERNEAVQALLSRTDVLDWRNRPHKFSRTTVYKKLKLLEETGSSGGLRRKKRADAGESKVLVSRAWDAAVPFSLEVKRRIADEILQEMRGRIKGRESISDARIGLSNSLKVKTLAEGYSGKNAAHLASICRWPDWRFWEAAAPIRRVAQHKYDRKASEDAMPYITRRIPDRPGFLYVYDVHHINVLVREGGKTGTVKMISCLDMGTMRLTADYIFFEGRGGVRNIDTIELDRRTFADAAWGVPAFAYFDNGSEYNYAPLLEDALRLAHGELGSDRSRVLTTLPYRPRSKPVEHVFSMKNQSQFKLVPGFIGDDRFNPERPKLGKMPKPFGGFADFVRVAEALLVAYNNKPQEHGQLKGLSPNERFQQCVEMGWAAVTMDPAGFDGVFVERITRQVTNHAVSVDNRRWTCRELDRFLGPQVIVCRPIYHAYNELRIEHLDGRLLGVAEPDEVFDFIDARGIHRSNDRRTATVEAIRELDRSIPDFDVLGHRLAEAACAVPIRPNAPAGTVSVSQRGTSAGAIVPRRGRSRDTEAQKAERLREYEQLLVNQHETLLKLKASQ